MPFNEASASRSLIAPLRHTIRPANVIRSRWLTALGKRFAPAVRTPTAIGGVKNLAARAWRPNDHLRFSLSLILSIEFRFPTLVAFSLAFPVVIVSVAFSYLLDQLECQRGK